MQIGTIDSISKYVFAIAVIAILVYIVVRMRRVNVGNWTIDGSSDDVLKFVSPKKDVIFTVQQGNQGVTVKNYLIKGDDYGLQFFNPNLAPMTRFREKEVYLGDMVITNKDENGNPKFVAYDIKNNRMLLEAPKSHVQQTSYKSIPTYNII